MDEDGFCQFASLANLAHRAIVPLEAAEAAIIKLEAPDPNSSDPDNEGRRIQRVPGGWMVLNASKYKEVVTRANAREKTRERVRRFRDKERNADVTLGNVSVTPSVSETESESKGKQDADSLPSLTLARKVIEECCLPANWAMMNAVEGAIDYCVKRESRTKDQAVKFLTEQAAKALTAGEKVNRFWFDDRAWRPKTNSPNSSPVSEDATSILEQRRKQRAAGGAE